MSFVNSFIVEITRQNLRHSQVKVFKNIWDETEIRTISIARQVRISILWEWFGKTKTTAMFLYFLENVKLIWFYTTFKSFRNLHIFLGPFLNT